MSKQKIMIFFYFVAGIWMIIAMSIYTGKLNEYHKDNSGSYLKWPPSWALGWTGASMEIAAGFCYMCGFSPLVVKPQISERHEV